MGKSTEDLIRELEDGGVLGTGRGVAPSPTRPPVSAKPRAGIPTLLLIVAVMAVAIIGALPFGSLALYPFALFVTLLHECSHAFVAIATGGTVAQLELSSNLSGYTLLNGGVEALTAPAGYLGATAAGIALLATPIRFARQALAVLALFPLAALLAFHPASIFTAVWCLVFAVALGLAAWKLSPRAAGFLQIFLGVEAGLNAFRDLTTLIFISGAHAHIQTDADLMSQALFLPPFFWAVAWTVCSVALVAVTLALVVRRDIRQLRSQG